MPSGRPKKEVNLEQLEKLMGYRPSLYDTAGFFKCSREKIQDLIKEEYDMNFIDFRKYYGSEAKLSLIQKAMSMALNKERPDKEMLKFCIINLAGWTNGFHKDQRFDEDDTIDDLEWIE